MTSHPLRQLEQNFSTKMSISGKFQSHMQFKTIGRKHLSQTLQSQFNCETYPIVQISSSKLPMTPLVYRLVKQTFGSKMVISEGFQFYI